MFLSHFLSLIAGIFIGVGTNLLVNSTDNFPAWLFLLAGVFISSSGYILSSIYETCRKTYGSCTKEELKKTLDNNKFKWWVIKVKKNYFVYLCFLFGILCVVFALI